jgi:branched-chain amino acid aminotransferase
MIVFWNGQFVPVSQVQIDPFSQSLHYGNAVFEGLRSYPTAEGPRIFKGLEHFNRLHASARQLYLNLDYEAEYLLEVAHELIRRNRLEAAYIRPLVFAGDNLSLVASAGTQVLMMAFEWGRLLGNAPVNLTVSSYRKQAPDSALLTAKVSGNYANSVLATSEARLRGFHEALLLDQDGFVAQASASNLFLEQGERLITPSSSGNIFPGITRSVVIELAREIGIQVEERDVTLEDLRKAESAFLAGTATEIAPVARVDSLAMPLRWEDSLGHTISRKYRHAATQRDVNHWALI